MGSLLLTISASQGLIAQENIPFTKAVQTQKYLEPTRVYEEQNKISAQKLKRLEKKTGKKPNILIMIVDDMGYGDPGVYGGGNMIGAPTPHIDSIAKNGLLLTSTYSQPTCTPTRAAMMTGRFPARSGLTRPILTGESPTVNPWADEVTAASLLSKNGYITALSGKWHLGEQDGYWPHQVGYDEYFGILSVSSEFTQGMVERQYPDMVYNPERMAVLNKLSHRAITAGKKGGKLETVQAIKTLDELAEIDQDVAKFSEQFIRKAVKENKPFYLVHSFIKVHNDNYPAKAFKGKSPAKFPYKDSVIEVDDIVGRLTGLLKELKIDDNTFIFFTSDNGANEDLWPDSGYQPFKGGKGTTWEGGVRVPGIAYWPGMIKAGKQSDGLFDLMDLFNTSLALAGVEKQISPDRYIDGLDQTSFLLADDGKSNREAVFMYSEKTFMALRWEEYKIHMKVFDVKRPMSNLDEATILNVGMSPWIYNLYMDPKEQASTGHRFFEWGIGTAVGLTREHADTYKDFPMKDIGLGMAGK
ncbi:MAG: sulfatase-like hydrolase/transferase [Gammaproteobacteria bacterium]|nr:sulfatase-like hydrolase/transferase [Gammaproteobacteria bacterium]